MFEIYKQIGVQNMTTEAITGPDSNPGTIIQCGTVPCGAIWWSHLSKPGGACGRATFKHLIIAGELHGY
jgi:hypothetical protein